MPLAAVRLGGDEADPAAPALARTASFWEAHAAGLPTDLDVAATVLDDEPGVLLDYFTDRLSRVRRVRLRDLAPGPKSVAGSMGVSEAFHGEMKRFLTCESHWDAYLHAATCASENGRRTAFTNEAYTGYQVRAVRDRVLNVPDPLDHATARVYDGFQIFGRTCYMAFGKKLFYLITGGAGAKALCIYVPEIDLLIDLEANLNKLLDLDLMANTLRAIAKRIATHARAYNALVEAAAAGRAEPRQIVIGMQNAQNFAHHYWNYYTGIEKVVLAGVADNVSRVLFASSEFFGPLEALYPEFVGRIEKNTVRNGFDPCPFSLSELYISVGGYFIPSTLRDRIRTQMGVVARAEAVDLAGGSPVVWIGLRLADKSWLEQESELPVLINRLMGIHPDAVVLLDGFSYPVGEDQISDQWAPLLSQLDAVAAAIRSRCDRPDRVISMIGNSLAESVMLAAQVDAYLAPIGTTQHKIGWFSDAPGIVYHPSHGTGTLRRERMPGAWEAEAIALPHYVAGAPAAPGVRRGEGDRRVHIENVSLPTDEVTQLLLSILEERLSRRPR